MVRGYLMLLLVLGAAWRCPAGELTPRQASTLESLANERFAPRWETLGTNELAELRLKVDRYESALRKDHLVGGLVVSLRYADAQRSRVVAYEALEDSVAWTGFHLGSQAIRYAVERRPATLEAVREVLGGIERLIQSTGRSGGVPRFAGPAGDPAYQAVYSRFGGPDPQRPGFGRLAFPGTNGLVWLAGPSRDAYSGLNLGLALTHKFIREPGIQARVSNIIDQVMTRIDQDGGRLDDGRAPAEFLPPILRAACLRTAASAVGRSWPAKYEKVAELLSAQDMVDEVGLALPRHDDVRPFVFATADLFALNRLETNRTRKLMYQEMLSKIWRSSIPELNPWIAGAAANVDDLRPMETKAALAETMERTILQGVLYAYPAWPRTAVPQAMPSGRPAAWIEANGHSWARHPLPVYARPVQPFQWVQAGRSLAAQAPDPTLVHPGVDLMLPYWLARNAGVILPEDLPPLRKAAPTRATGSRVGTTNAFGRVIGTNPSPVALPPFGVSTNRLEKR